MNNKPKSSNRHGIAPEENKKKRKSKKKLSYCKDYGIVLLEYNIVTQIITVSLKVLIPINWLINPRLFM